MIFLSFLAQFNVTSRTDEYLDNITVSTNGGSSAVTSLLRSAWDQNLILTITVTASFCVKLKIRPLFHPHLTYTPLPYSLHQPLSAIPTAACPDSISDNTTYNCVSTHPFFAGYVWQVFILAVTPAEFMLRHTEWS